MQHLSVVRNSEDSEVSTIREQKMYYVYGKAVGTSTVVRYNIEEVHYREGLLSEVPLWSLTIVLVGRI